MKRMLIITGKVLSVILIAVAVFMMIFTVVSSLVFNRNDRNLFGYKAFIVTSDSMRKTDFKAGDLIFIRNTAPDHLREGDIISYQSTNKENYGETVTHKIRSLTQDAEGNPGFITYGTTTDVNDENVVIYSYVLGKYQGKIPGIGYFFQFIKTTPGYIACIFAPFFLLILLQVLNSIRIFRKYRKQQLEELQAEKDAISAERAESQRMMAELLELKKQLADNRQTEREPEEETERESENGQAG